MRVLCSINIHAWRQFLAPSNPDGSLWPGQLQRVCSCCGRHEASFPRSIYDSGWTHIRP